MTLFSSPNTCFAKEGKATGGFPKSSRILTRSHYKFLQRSGYRLHGEKISIGVRRGRVLSPKLGITVSKKFGKAHERNRFKRVVREVFRELIRTLPSDLEINISPSPRRQDVHVTKAVILQELLFLLSGAHKYLIPGTRSCVNDTGYQNKHLSYTIREK